MRSRRKVLLLLLLLVVLLSTVLLAVAFDSLINLLVTIEGKITDEKGLPILGADIIFGNYRASTDIKGFYKIEIPQGNYNMRVVAEGYLPFSSSLNAVQLKTSYNVTLSKKAPGEIKPDGGDGGSTNIWDSTQIKVDNDPYYNGSDSAFLFLIRGFTNTSYIRNFVGELYQDGDWYLPENSSIVQYTGGIIKPKIADYVKSSQIVFRIQPLTVFGGFVPSVKNPDYILLNSSLQYYVDEQIFFSEYRFTSPYNVSYTLYRFDGEVLRRSETLKDSRYLNVPSELLEELRPLALSITQYVNSPFEKVLAIEDFIYKNYMYDPIYNRTPPGVDPIHWFIFHSKRGTCTHLNSALVLLARSIGIPARLCAGYLIDANKDYQIVRRMQRHAYAEVLFKNLGWITFDATAPSASEGPSNGTSGQPKPTLRIIYPSQGAYISGSDITITGEASGFFANANFTSDQNFRLTFWDHKDFVFDNSSFIEDGRLRVTIRVVDFSGNNASDSVEFTVDNTPPKVKIQYPSDGMTVLDSIVIVNGTVEELNKGNFKPSIDDSRFTLASWDESTGIFSFVNNTSISGEVSLKVSFEDLALNNGSDVVTFTVNSQPKMRIPTKTVITHCSSVAVKGQTFLVEGQVFDINDTRISSLSVLIFITKSKNKSGMLCGQGSTIDGFFNITCSVCKEIRIGNYLVVAHTVGDDRYEGSWSDPPIKIIAETEISISAPSEVVMGKNFTINGALKEKLTGEPIADEILIVTVDGRNYSAMTDRQGQVIGNYTLLTPGDYMISLTFNGSENYLFSACSTPIRVLDIGISPATDRTLFILAASLPTSIVAISAFIWHKRRKKNPSKTQEAKVETAPAAAALVVASEKPKPILSIKFPQILDSFPTVWGVGDPLLISLRIDNDFYKSIPLVDAMLKVDEKTEFRLKMANDGEAQVTHIFDNKGIHKLKATLLGRNKEDGATSEADIRIVDYKEEVVDLFNSFLNSLKAKFQSVLDEMTPREVQAVIVDQVPASKHESLETIVSIFEVADYSLHSIKRKDYEQMYISLKKFEG